VNRWNDSCGQPPTWASFFGAEGWARFVAAIVHDLAQRGIKYTLDAEDGCVRLADGSVLGLSNLALMCFREHSLDRWPEIVAYHVGMAIGPGDTLITEALAKDFDQARRTMKLRLWGRESLPQVPLIAWDIADDLVAVLTFDLPQTLVSVRREDATAWGVSKDELWRTAMANVHAEGLLPAPALETGNGAEVWVIDGETTFFAASHVLFLEAYGAAASPYGAIVAVPRRHLVLFHPIIDLRIIDAVSSMLAVVPWMFREGPGSITSSLYWWRRDQALMRLPWEATDEAAITFLPPAPFVTDVFDRLPPPPRR
jgi:hypothetical protein